MNECGRNYTAFQYIYIEPSGISFVRHLNAMQELPFERNLSPICNLCCDSLLKEVKPPLHRQSKTRFILRYNDQRGYLSNLYSVLQLSYAKILPYHAFNGPKLKKHPIFHL